MCMSICDLFAGLPVLSAVLLAHLRCKCPPFHHLPGNLTWGMTLSEESGMPGSAAMLSITVLVSTAMTPTGTPPSRARPVTTVRAQPACRVRRVGGWRVGWGCQRVA
jgi:hypothetical protein